MSKIEAGMIVRIAKTPEREFWHLKGRAGRIVETHQLVTGSWVASVDIGTEVVKAVVSCLEDLGPMA